MGKYEAEVLFEPDGKYAKDGKLLIDVITNVYHEELDLSFTPVSEESGIYPDLRIPEANISVMFGGLETCIANLISRFGKKEEVEKYRKMYKKPVNI